jgi:hypothetical protein
MARSSSRRPGRASSSLKLRRIGRVAAGYCRDAEEWVQDPADPSGTCVLGLKFLEVSGTPKSLTTLESGLVTV